VSNTTNTDIDTPFFNDPTDPDARIFKNSFGFSPRDIIGNDDRINVNYVWWSVSNLAHVNDSEGPASTESRKAWLMNALTGNNPDIWKDFSYVDGIISESVTMADYRKNPDQEIYHPSAVSWAFCGMMNCDHRGNSIKEPAPFVVYINSPNNRVKLFDIANKIRKFPTTKELKVNQGQVFGTYVPYKGVILTSGLSGTNKKFANKIKW
jgi:hypothetical protein